MYLLANKNYMNFFLSKSIYSRRGAGRRGGADRNAPFTCKRGMGVPAPLQVHGHLCAQTEAGGPSLSRTPIRVLPLRTNRGDVSGFVHSPQFVCPKRRRAGGGTKMGGAPPSPTCHPIRSTCKPGVGLQAASHPRAPIEGEAQKGGAPFPLLSAPPFRCRPCARRGRGAPLPDLRRPLVCIPQAEVGGACRPRAAPRARKPGVAA